MKKNLISCILLFCLTAGNVYSQKAKVANADKKYENYAFFDAIKTYERVAEKGYKSEDMFQKLGNAYYFNAELEKAVKWYGELFAMNQEQEAEYCYRYAQCLKSVGDYAQADKMLNEFNKKSGNDLRAQLYDKNRNYLEVIKANSGRYNIEDAGVNSEFSDYGSTFYNNKLVFASARDTGGVSKKIFKWTNQSFTNLYESQVDTRGKLGEPKLFPKEINTKFNESTPVFTKDGETMYFTRNNYLNGKEGKDSKKTMLLKIYKATNKKGKWEDVTALPFNSDQYSVAHPALSPDDKTLYFASDMPGTLGQSDLYKVAIKEDGSFGVPENLGPMINTPGKETFPFVSEDNELYFATDGWPGLGGLDVFVAKIEGENSYSEAQNVGEPVNSSTDDFAFIIDTKSNVGFFTSNRDGGKGYDDIYKFSQTKKLLCSQELSGIVTDKETTETLENVQVILFDNKFRELNQVTTNDKGEYSFKVECSQAYYVRSSKNDYTTEEQKVVASKASGKIDLPLVMEKKQSKVKEGDNLADAFGIKVIYFDLDKAIIRSEAAFELEKILDVMKQFPKMKIDVRSHTDCRQTAEYNQALSERRSKATVDWLIKNGIAPDRVTGKGYGESQLVNNCQCEGSKPSNCTEAQHQENRRSEFIIIAL